MDVDVGTVLNINILEALGWTKTSKKLSRFGGREHFFFK